MPQTQDLNIERPRDDRSAPPKDPKQRKIADNLDSLHGELYGKLSKYVSDRYDKEAEWLAAEELYNGISQQVEDKQLAAMRSIRSKELPMVNITRPKTNIAIARLQDIQFPLGGDMNFSVSPTPMPELEELKNNATPVPTQPAPQFGPDGAPIAPEGAPTAPPPPSIGELATIALRKASDAADRMERQIHDRFVETEWAKKARRSMEQMGILGSGLLKAPVLTHKRKKSYRPEQTSTGNTIRALDYTTTIVPTIQWVDIRLWFPDPGARPGTRIDDCFELHPMTKRELRNLTFNPAFMKDEIRQVMSEEPTDACLGKSYVLSLLGAKDSAFDKRYSVIEYHGTLDKDVLFEMDLIDEEEKDDPLVIVQGEVWFTNGRIIRVSLSPIEGDEDIPYHLCTWEDDPTCVLGHGIPYLMRHAQRVANSSWLMLLDNAGLTAGPQIVLNKEMIQPANPSEGWSIRPMKVWFMTEYGTNVNEAMQFVNVPTQQDSITNIIELAMQFADVESSIPQIVQGDMPQGNNTTFGGMAVVMSASHIIQQRISERWDDNMTVPIVKRYYHYEMQYNEDDSIKGDYEVNAGGATERIDKQVRAQDLERIIGMAGSNEMFMEQIDIGEAFREWVATTRAGSILKDRAAIEQERAAKEQAAAQQQEQDPALIEAQARAKQADAAIEKIAMDREYKDKEFDLRAQIEEARVDKESREIVARERENQIKLQVAQMQREDVIIKIAADQKKTEAQVAKDLQISIMTDETKRLLKQADLDKFNTEIAVKEKTGEGI